jgi:hypothetical protein
MTARSPHPKQASRYGKSAICIFVKPDAKQRIIAALATAGYGMSFQEGIVNLLNQLLIEQHQAPMT